MTDWNLDRIEELVDRLESEDAFERLKASEELSHLTRQTLGFRFNDPASARAAAVSRWKEQIESRKEEARQTEKLKAAIELTGAEIDVSELKEAIHAIPAEKVQGYLNALILKMKSEQVRCDACHARTATVRVTELERGAVRTRHYCDLCARERGDVLV